MKNDKFNVKLGFAPTRRDVFSKEDAQKFKKIIKDKLLSWGVDMIDIDWLNDEGLLYNDADVCRVAATFKEAGVDAVFSPHCNFGTENAVAKLAKSMDKPFLLWGPRDDAPLPDGTRTRDTQCGLFATSKILRRLNVPYTYIVNSWVDAPVFEKGFKNFMAAACVVKNFRKLKIGQIAPRPQGFWTMIVNEGELLERFGIEVRPTTIPEILAVSEDMIKKGNPKIKETVDDIKSKASCENISEDELKRIAGLKLSMIQFAEENELSAIAMQCWDALQGAYSVFPCFANSEVTEIGIPVTCETDIHGAVGSVMAQAAVYGKTVPFFADLTVRNPINENSELLWHCGPFPHSLIAPDSPRNRVGRHFINPSMCAGTAEWKIKGGDITIVRFDGDNGMYNLFVGEAKGTDGPDTLGTYVWVEVDDWPKWEERLIRGPYVHHVTGIHGKVAPVMYEAVRYIPGLCLDAIDPTPCQIDKMLRGE